MKSITKPDHLDNIGSIIKLWYVPVDDVMNIARPMHEYGSIALAENKEWFEMYFSPQSAFYKLKFKPGHKGSLYDCRITGVIPKQDQNNNNRINQLRDIAFICKVLDANGYYRIIGTSDFPLRFAFDFNTGKKPSDRNSVDFTFACQTKYAPIFIYSEDGSPY